MSLSRGALRLSDAGPDRQDAGADGTPAQKRTRTAEQGDEGAAYSNKYTGEEVLRRHARPPPSAQGAAAPATFAPSSFYGGAVAAFAGATRNFATWAVRRRLRVPFAASAL